MDNKLLKQYKTSFQKDGFILLKKAIDIKSLSLMNSQLNQWIEESKKHNKPA